MEYRRGFTVAVFLPFPVFCFDIFAIHISWSFWSRDLSIKDIICIRILRERGGENAETFFGDESWSICLDSVGIFLIASRGVVVG